MTELRQRIPFGNNSRNPHNQPTNPLTSDVNEVKNRKKSSFYSKTVSFFSTDRGILLGLFAVSLFTRFFRLSHPNVVIFDEFHFGTFTEKLLDRKFFFDIHPWLGKLTLAGLSKLFGYKPQGGDFDYKVTDTYLNDTYYYARIPAALFGSFIPGLMYLICRELQFQKFSALTTASLPLFDNLLLLESRFILIDSQLLFYLHLSLLSALKFFSIVRNSDGRRSFKRVLFLFLTAFSTACAMGVKWTAGVTPFLIAVTCFFGIWHLKKPLPLYECLFAGVVGFGFYVIPWYIFLKVATHSTSDGASRMTYRFRSTLQGNETHFPYTPSNMTFFERFQELHIRQFVANKKIKTRHKYESRWYEWPLNIRGIFFYAGKGPGFSATNPVVQGLNLIQNPAGALWVTASVVLLAISVPIFYRYRHEDTTNRFERIYNLGSFLLSAYVANLLPYIFVERCYFMYHYLPALKYGQIIFGLMIDSLPKKVGKSIAAVTIVTVFGAFIYWSPWVYYLTLHFDDFKKRRWMPRWD